MPIPLTLNDGSPLVGPISQAVNEIRKGKTEVVIDATWIRHHGFKFSNYSDFETAFLLELRKTVRKRFVEQKKSDEFAIKLGNHVLDYIIISLQDLGSSIRISAPVT